MRPGALAAESRGFRSLSQAEGKALMRAVQVLDAVVEQRESAVPRDHSLDERIRFYGVGTDNRLPCTGRVRAAGDGNMPTANVETPSERSKHLRVLANVQKYSGVASQPQQRLVVQRRRGRSRATMLCDPTESQTPGCWIQLVPER